MFVGEHIADVISEVIGSNHVPITQSPESTSQERDIQKEDKVIIKAESSLGDIPENSSTDYVNYLSSIHVTSKSRLINYNVKDTDQEWRLEEVLVVVTGSVLSTVLLLLTVALILCKVMIC